METLYKRELNHTYLILELPSLYEEDYQMKMLQVNRIEGLLSVAGKGVDGKSQYFYEISGRTSLKSMYEKAEIQKSELEKFLVQFLQVLREVQRYLLNVNRLLLDPEYIFFGEERYYFCYLPVQETELCREFHCLTEYFVSKISHSEQEGILLACELHKATMEENYSLGKIVEKLIKKGEKQVDYVRNETVIEPYEDDWIDYQETECQVLRESHSAWQKIVKNRRKRKDVKWGEW